jgi:hypothetical protein
VQFTVPWPFITRDANPVHVYDAEAVTVDSQYCFRDNGQLPLNGSPYPATITYADWSSGLPKGPVGSWTVDCDKTPPPALPNGQGLTCKVRVDFTIPPSGKAYVNLRLDYGAKGAATDFNPKDGSADRYDPGFPVCSGDTFYPAALVNDSNPTPQGPVALSACTTYAFSHSGSGSGNDAVQNVNTFKRIYGVFGQVISSSNGAAWQNVPVTLKNASGAVIATSITDKDGFYGLNYKHTGKAARFTVVLGNVSQVVTLKANGWAEVDYDVTTGTWYVEVSGTNK